MVYNSHLKFSVKSKIIATLEFIEGQVPGKLIGCEDDFTCLV